MAWLEETVASQQNRTSFYISIPTRGTVSNESLASFMGLRIPGEFGMPLYGIETGQAIDVSRNIAVSKCLQSNARYFVCIDSDMTFNPDTLERLLSYRLPVVSVAYRSSGPPYSLVANVGDQVLGDDVLKAPNVDLVKVDSVGLGFCLIDIRVLKNLATKLEWRCFLDHSKQIKKEVALYDAKQAIEQNYKCSICNKLLIARFFWSRAGMQNKDAISEDYYFCKLLRDNHVPIHVSTKTFAYHQSNITLGPDGPQTNLRSVGDVE